MGGGVVEAGWGWRMVVVVVVFLCVFVFVFIPLDFVVCTGSKTLLLHRLYLPAQNTAQLHNPKHHHHHHQQTNNNKNPNSKNRVVGQHGVRRCRKTEGRVL